MTVRCADGTGFGTRIDALEVFWRAAGSPQILRFGGSLPSEMPGSATGLMPATPSKTTAGFDLLQGAYAVQAATTGRVVRRLALVAAFGLLAHVGVLAAETVLVQRIAATRERELQTAIAELAPGLPVNLPLDEVLRRALPETGPAFGFLPLLAEVAEALTPVGGQLSFRSLTFDSATGGIALLVEGPDIATLQSVEADSGRLGA